MAEFVWLKHPEGTEPAPFAADAAEAWQARGWEPAEKPTDLDPTAEPTRPPWPAQRAAETPAGDEPADDTTPKTAGRQRRAKTEES